MYIFFRLSKKKKKSPARKETPTTPPTGAKPTNQTAARLNVFYHVNWTVNVGRVSSRAVDFFVFPGTIWTVMTDARRKQRRLFFFKRRTEEIEKKVAHRVGGGLDRTAPNPITSVRFVWCRVGRTCASPSCYRSPPHPPPIQQLYSIYILEVYKMGNNFSRRRRRGENLISNFRPTPVCYFPFYFFLLK